MRRRRNFPDESGKRTIAYAIAAAVLAAIAYFSVTGGLSLQQLTNLTDHTQPTPYVDYYHIHADFAVFVDGERINFSDPRYGASAASEKGRYVHLHIANEDGDKVMHIHARNVPVSWFFDAVGMELTRKCLDTGAARHCDEGSRTLKLFVKNEGKEWKQILNLEEYVPLDADRMLISYGGENESGLMQQMNSVSNFSRNYSGPDAVG